MTRPRYKEEAAKVGRIAEKWINDVLMKKNYNFEWHNKNGETMSSPDFHIIGSQGQNIAGIEVERKGEEYKKFLKYGLHFIADKVDRLCVYSIPIYYYIVMGDKTIVYYKDVKSIKKYKTIRKDTLRMKNELFYEVPINNCNSFDFKFDAKEQYFK